MILAPGILGTNAYLLKRVAESGAGAVTTKSFSINERKGYENPTVIELIENEQRIGLLNAIGLANPGFEKFKKELEKFKSHNSDTALIVSIFGTIDEFSKLAGMTENYADAIEIDVSCPHVDDSISKNPKILKNLISEIKDIISNPLIVKISPNVTDIKEIAKAAIDGGCDALAAINTVRAMKIDINFAKPVLANKFGGYSGTGIKPIAVAKIYEIYSMMKKENLDVPLIGIGGVTCGNDAIEMLMAGASAVGIGSAVYYRGIDVFGKILNEMNEFMNEHNYKNIEEIKGIAVE
ncbi:MAG: dihydroorotate dehydrogenase B catalytic subunit [Candidatus Altiarchaeales archaeon A3]|nr:MAG: dihydroorotate dehydrogenase B catalytic subunit [Candidatus Altiarchaeales archaeon A3]